MQIRRDRIARAQLRLQLSGQTEATSLCEVGTRTLPCHKASSSDENAKICALAPTLTPCVASGQYRIFFRRMQFFPN